MTKLLRYFKPHVLMILLCVVLLFGQAMADLALPDRMSDIVNNGLQQGGVTSALPEAVSSATFDRMLLFVPQSEKDAVVNAYTPVSTVQDAVLVERFPALENEPGYGLRETDPDRLAALEPVVGRALMAYGGVLTLMEEPEKASAFTGGFDVSQIPPGTDLFAVLGQAPAEQLSQMLAPMQARLGALEDSMVSQAAVQTVLGEYKALGMDMAKTQNRYILWAGLQMLLISLGGALSSILVCLLAARVAAGVANTIRHDVFSKVESFSQAEFDKFSTASLITRTTNDVTQVQMVTVMIIRMLLYAPIMGVGGVIFAVQKSTSMTWIIGLAVLIMLCMVGVVFVVAMPRFRIVQKLVDRLNLVTRENLSGMMVIRAYNTQAFEESRFDKANLDLTKNSRFINRVMSAMMPVMMLVMNGVMLLIMWVGAHQIAESAMRVGDMMAFIQYTMQIVMSFLMLSMMFIMLPRASVSGVRINEVLSTEISIVDPPNPKRFSDEALRGVIEFKNVTFRFPGALEDTLHDLSFTALPGKTTAFIGPTGSGKSTLINLIPRLYDVTGGSITVSGRDVREVTQRDLHDQLGYVPQKGVLFSGTVESNLKYGCPDASDETMRLAADIAQAEEFIAALPERYESPIAQGGTNVSGGQRQRLSIARAIAKKPPVYIFDDSFSALDFKTDAALRRALHDVTGDSTMLVVAQRVGTIMHADQIVVLDEGRVVGIGRHEQLLKTCDVYREIAQSQLRKEDLA